MNKPQIENLKAWMTGRDLNLYQKADAVIEFNKLLDYVEHIEQLTTTKRLGRSEQLPQNFCTINQQTCGKGSGCKYPHCHL